jgi:hypothetical protein
METPEHMFECAYRAEIEACFRDRYRSLQPRETEPIDISALRPWDWLGLLQGRVHPNWKSMIPTLQQGMQRTASTAAVIQQLLRASLETWYHAIWQPRCKRAIEQEQSQGLYQGTKIRRMRAESRRGMHATPSPTPNLPQQLSDRPRTETCLQPLYISIDGNHYHTLNAENLLHLAELLAYVGQLAMKVPETL